MTKFRNKAKERPASKPQEVAGLLDAVAKQLNMDTWVQGLAVRRLWNEVVDPPWNEQSRAVAIKQKNRKTVLLVQVANALAASDLRFSTEAYRQKLNAYQSQTGLRVDAIEVTVGRSSSYS